MKKKVAFVSAVFAPVTGGMATVAVAEAAALAEDADVTVYTLASVGAHDTHVPYTVHRLTGFPRVSLSGFVPQLVWQLRHAPVVYAQVPAYGFVIPLIFWKLLFRRRLVVTLHMDPIGEGWQKIFFACARVPLRILLLLADHVRVSTESFARTQLLRGVSSVQVIPFGVRDIFHPIEKKWNIKPTFLFVGRLSRTHYFKGVPQLLHAFAEVRKLTCNASLRIVGDGDLRAEFESQARQLGIAEHVVFLGSISDVSLAHEYGRAHVLVLPSTDTSETFGMVLLEALASGTPIIASHLPGVETFFSGETIGKLVPPGDVSALAAALHSVCADPVWWQRAAAHAHTISSTYGSWKQVARRLMHLLY